MNSSVKLGLGLGLFAAVIFGVTLVSQFAGSPPAGPVVPGGDTDLGPPLRFSNTRMAYEPESEELTRRTFPGAYERGEQLHTASFWFQNPHPKPVRVAMLGRSCSACTTARIAVVAPATLTELIGRAQAGRVPASFGPDLMSAAAATGLLTSLKWETLDFDKPEVTHEIPAAAADGTPTLGVFQMLFKVTAVGPKTLEARLGMALPDRPGAGLTFDVSFLGVPAFEVRPASIPLGDVPEGAPPRTAELIAWSATRRTDGTDLPFPPPAVAIAPNDKYVQAGAPTPLSEAEVAQLAARLRAEGKGGRVAGAYRIPVTVYRRLPTGQAAPGQSPEPDIGPFERQIGFVVPAVDPVTIQVTGTITGLVTVVEKGLVDLGSFRSQSGAEKTVELASDRSGLELSVLAAECVPNYLAVTLTDRQGTGGRRLWGLTVKVPPGACLSDLPADAAVVLRATVGGEARKVKIPVKGRAYTRG